ANYGVDNYYADYKDLLAADEVEAVSISTPVFTHSNIVCDAAAAGKHILCEKPMAMNAAEAAKMLKACNKAGVKLGIASSRSRLRGPVILAKKYISEGKLGKIYYARHTTLRRRGRPFELHTANWFMDSSKAGGGALIDIGCYDIDVMLYLLGSPQPTSVSAITFKGVGTPPKLDVTYDVEEHASLFVRFDNGSAVTFEVAWASNMEGGESADLFGTKGGLRLSPFTYYATMDDSWAAFVVDMHRRWVRDHLGTTSYIEDFADACLENRDPLTPGEDGLKVMQIINMAYLSAKLGREVTLEDL
ncbi:MAG: Gfo/Idh/MocA family oxidoreductase, partial [Candidatus Bathyarchaeota archaeon]|nr:Gfo/Idh/MocA family oxidoreductase [Candidatus Bathyarchaeota archaeon]